MSLHLKIRSRQEKSHPVLKEMFRFLAVIIGAVTVAAGLELFLVPNDFLDGGVTGISIMLTHYFGLPLGVFIAILNTPFIVLTMIYSGWKSSVRTIVGIAALSFSTILLHGIEPLTDEFSLALGYGGVLVGFGVGLALRYGGALDGMEALSVIISNKTRFNIDQIILGFNLIIFVVAAFAISAESAMASFLLFYIVVTPIIKKVMEGGDETKTAQIVTTKPKEVTQLIHEEFNKRVLITQAHRTVDGEILGNSENNVAMLNVIIARIEESRLTELVEELDSEAIIVFHDTVSIHGNVIKKNAHH